MLGEEDKKFNILLADQDQTTLNLLNHILHNKRCVVFNATSAKAALSIAKKKNIHLAVVDLELSGNHGIELIPKLKALHPNIRVIFTSSDPSIEIETKARTAGIILFMPKPLDLGLMERAVAKGLKDATYI